MHDVPRLGRLHVLPLPRLLVALRASGYSGGLRLVGEAVEKRVLLLAGNPVKVESDLPGDALPKLLESAGVLSAEEAEKAREVIAERGGKEEAAVASLKKLNARELVKALRDATRRRLLDMFSWTDGEFHLEPDLAPAPGSEALAVDALVLVRDGLAAHWPPEQMLSQLGAKLTRYPVQGEAFGAAAEALAGDPAGDRLIGALDDTHVVWTALQSGSAPSAVATLWVLDALGVLDFREAVAGAETPEEKPDSDAVVEESGPEIEIVITGDRPAGGSTARARGRKAEASSKAAAKEKQAETLRAEVLEKYENLADLDYYELLGVDASADAGLVKRAYLKAAKRYHPDALIRMGLAELSDQANEVFARISKAHGVLTDPEQRRNYEASQGGHEEIDAERVAQAETLYRKGEILLKAGNFAGATELLEGSVQLWPEDPAYQGALGWALFRKKPSETERAREHLAKSIELEPCDAQTRQRLAIVLRELGDTAGADQAAADAQAMDPNAKA